MCLKHISSLNTMTMLLPLCLIVLVANVASEGCHFGYTGSHGVNQWGEDYNECLGKHQSPINIDSEHVTHVKQPPFKMNGFDAKAPASLNNNGHTAMMTMDTKPAPTISGGPLGAVYEFAQLHFHWGDSDICGGENELNNKQYPLEMHAVFYKQECVDFNSALAHSDGLTVLGFLFEIDEKENENYNELVKTLNKITQTNAVKKIDNPPSLFELMPQLSSYFTYNGSLTTPPCTESVIWIEFDHTVKISHEQLQSFRSLTDSAGSPMVNNFRAVQPLGDRVVFYCNNDIDDCTLSKKARKIISKATDKLLEVLELLLSLVK